MDNKQRFPYFINERLVPAIINNDGSELSAEDKEAVEEWLETKAIEQGVNISTHIFEVIDVRRLVIRDAVFEDNCDVTGEYGPVTYICFEVSYR